MLQTEVGADVAPNVSTVPDRVNPTGRYVSVREIFDLTARLAGVSADELRGGRMSPEHTSARSVAFWAARRYGRSGCPSIGRWAGGFDSTTVAHAELRVDAARHATLSGLVVRSVGSRRFEYISPRHASKQQRDATATLSLLSALVEAHLVEDEEMGGGAS